MSNKYYYSAVANGFYQSIVHSEMPPDVQEITLAEYGELLLQQESGKVISSVNGLPIAIEAPPLTTDELIAIAEHERSQLLSAATTAIAPLSDAVEFDIATDDERGRYDDLRRYRVLLTRVDTSTAPNITWPITPV